MTKENKENSLIPLKKYDLTVPEHKLIERGLLLVESLDKKEFSVVNYIEGINFKEEILQSETFKTIMSEGEDTGFITSDDIDDALFSLKWELRIKHKRELRKKKGFITYDDVKKINLLFNMNDKSDDLINLLKKKNIDVVETNTEQNIEEIKIENRNSEELVESEEFIVTITITGHVGHGKTSLLDAIRQTTFVDCKEVKTETIISSVHAHVNGHNIDFLDIRDDEFFIDERVSSVHYSDIVLLVVAADDGIMNQTIEAINQAKDEGIPIIVAINKIDKPGANPEKIKQTLVEYGLLSEQWGGDTIYCEISATSNINIEELLEMISLKADIMGQKYVNKCS